MNNNELGIFRTQLGHDIFQQKYAHEGCETWEKLSRTLIEDVCGDMLPRDEIEALVKYHSEMKFLAGGRYLYYAGRPNKYFNNCYLLKSEEDSREDWANLSWKAESALMTGGGIGNDYSIYRESGKKINKTGGVASGPIPKMMMINEIGRNVMQGGSRRSAIYASLNWRHGDIDAYLHCKDWYNMPVAGAYGKEGKQLTIGDLREMDFNYPSPLDMTNISINYDNAFLSELYGIDNPLTLKSTLEIVNDTPFHKLPSVFVENVRQAMKTGEPGFSFNFFEKENETLRNAPVAADTVILTDKGYRTVGSTLGSYVDVWTGFRYANTRFEKTKSDVDTVKVSMTGGRSITCDPDHEFFVRQYTGKGKRRGCKVVKVKAQNLRDGDYLDVQLPIPKLGEFDRSSYTMGFAIGDGSSSGNSIDITLCTDAKKEVGYLFDDVRSKSINDSRGYDRYYINKKLNKFDFTDRASFLAGWFDADGSVDFDQNRIRLSGEYDELVYARRLLEESGISSTISKPIPSGFGGKEDTRNLIIMQSYVGTFATIIPCKRLKLDSLVGYRSYRKSEISVKSITKGVNQDVYCCDVKLPEHSFIAEGVRISNCTEVTSEDDSDVCNLASINMSRIDDISEFAHITRLVGKFLVCGTTKAKLPYEKVYETRKKNRRLGLGLMGVHEWLLKRGSRYEVTPELHSWLATYEHESETGAKALCKEKGLSIPVAFRAIAPTGTIGLLAATTTGIEPLYSVAYKRRFLKGDRQWNYQYVIDGTAKYLIDHLDVDPNNIESAMDLAKDPERRIAFQADIQDYVDMSISSTINLPPWGDVMNNESRVTSFAKTLAKYSHRLRGFTCFPDGSRGGQPLTVVPYAEAVALEGQTFKEEFHDICDLTGGGTCGV